MSLQYGLKKIIKPSQKEEYIFFCHWFFRLIIADQLLAFERHRSQVEQKGPERQDVRWMPISFDRNDQRVSLSCL